MNELMNTKKIYKNDILGHAKVQLFNAESSEEEFCCEKDNMILTPQLSKFFTRLLMSTLLENSQLASSGDGIMRPFYPNANSGDTLKKVFQNLFRSIILLPDDTDVLEDENGLIGTYLGWANTYLTYSGDDAKRGTINLGESYFDVEAGKLRLVYDWPSHSANGSFQSVAFADLRYDATTYPTHHASTAFNAIAAKPFLKFFASLQATLGEVGTVYDYNNETFLIKINSASPLKFIDKTVDNYVALPRLLKANGSVYSINSACQVDSYVFTGTSGRTIYRYSKDSLSSNGIEYILSYFSSGYIKGIYAETSDIFWLYDDYSAIDPNTGEPYCNYLYKYKLSTNEVLDKIHRTQKVGTAGSVPLNMTIILKDGKLIEIYNSSSSSGAGCIYVTIYDLESGEILNESFTSISSSGSYLSLASYNAEEILFYFGFSSAQSSQQISANKFCLAQLDTDYGKFTRVVMPAPVTKLNTQTLKVTYDLIFPTDLLVL